MLNKVFLLFRAYSELTHRSGIYIRFFDDWSGDIYCYDAVELARFHDLCGAYEALMELIKGVA